MATRERLGLSDDLEDDDCGWCSMCGDERPCECDEQIADEVYDDDEEECDGNS